MEWIIDLCATAEILHKQTFNIDLTVNMPISRSERGAALCE